MVLCRSITLKFGNSSKLVFTKNSSALLRLATAVGLGMAALVSRGQTFNVIHDNQLGGYAVGRSVVEVSDGFLVFGEQAQLDSNEQDLSLTRFDLQGQYVSEERFVKPEDQFYWRPDPITKGPNGSRFIGMAHLQPIDSPMDTVLLLRLDAEGDTLWTTTLLTGYTSRGYKVIATADHFFIAGAYNTGILGDSLPAYAMRTDTSGGIQMFKRHRRGGAQAVAADTLLNMYLAGNGFWPNSITGKLCLMKMDSSGNEIWHREAPVPYGIWYGVQLLANGHLLCAGRRSFNPQGDPPMHMYLASYDTAGTLLWQYQGPMGQPTAIGAYTGYNDMYQDTDTTFIVCGGIQQQNWKRALVHRFTVDGDSLWRREYAHFANLSPFNLEVPWDIEPTSDGGMVLTGETWDDSNNSPHFSQHMWLLKLDSVGCLVPGCQYVGLNDIAFGLQDALTAYPNPSAGRFSLALSLPEAVHVNGEMQLQVFDAHGRLVVRKDLGTALEQSLVLDMSQEPAGLYSAHVCDAGRILTGTRVILE